MNKIPKELSNWSIDTSGLILKLDPLRDYLNIPNHIHDGYFYDKDEIAERLLNQEDELYEIATALRFDIRYMQSEELFWITEFNTNTIYPYMYIVDDAKIENIIYQRHFNHPNFITNEIGLGNGWTLVAKHIHSDTSPSNHLLQICVKNGLGVGGAGPDIIKAITFPIFLDYTEKHLANDYGFEWNDDYNGFYSETTGCLIQYIEHDTGVPSIFQKDR